MYMLLCECIDVCLGTQAHSELITLQLDQKGQELPLVKAYNDVVNDSQNTYIK